ncbi:MAG: response regulator [Xanthomonadales bacterium]|jgi:two-component system response regulator RegA|nr:response regulator [Xanthomonadales bacterium]
MRILIVEDDAAFAAQLQRSLERRGHAVSHAADPAAALQQARMSLPEAVLIDLKLGEQSGLALIEPLRALLPAARLLMLTGYASVATAVEAMRRGLDDYLHKPATLESIVASLSAGSGSAPVPLPTRMTPLNRIEWEHIQRAMVETEGNVSAAARLLGMHRRSLQRKLAKRPPGSPRRGSED